VAGVSGGNTQVKPLEVFDHYRTAWSDIGVHLPWLRDHAHGKVLEIGVRDGISTGALLVGVAHRGGHVWSVDTEDRSGLYDDEDYSKLWTFIQANSHSESDKVLESMGQTDSNFQIDLLFIDGDHTQWGAMCDLTTYGPWAKVIAIHDINSRFSGVWEAAISYFRWKENGPFSKAEFFNASHGLGVIYR
jgi:hypothetical protein